MNKDINNELGKMQDDIAGIYKTFEHFGTSVIYPPFRFLKRLKRVGRRLHKLSLYLELYTMISLERQSIKAWKEK